MSTAVLAPTTTTARRDTTGCWTLDPEHTVVTVRARALGFAVRGSLTGASGSIDVPADITCSHVTATVRSDTFTSGRGRHDRAVRGAGFLDADTNPTLDLCAYGLQPVLESLVTTEGDRPLWWLNGAITARGITRPVRLALGLVRHDRADDSLEFRATTRIRRSEFGAVGMRGVVGDAVDVTIHGRARRWHADT